MADEALPMDFASALASSVHDMKNSLGMVLGLIEEFVETSDPETTPNFANLQAIQYEGQRVNNQLIQLLAIYRIGEQAYTANISEVHLDDFLEECVLQCEPVLRARGIGIDSEVDATLVGFFDQDLVSGVINNVVNNAYRYARERVRLTAEQTDGYTVISIDDDGPGYPPSMLVGPEQARTTVSFRSGTSGLGLYFSSQVAHLHRCEQREGFITCSNDGIGGGGRFSIHLP